MQLLNTSTRSEFQPSRANSSHGRPSSRSFYNTSQRELALNRTTAVNLYDEYFIDLEGRTANFVTFSPYDDSFDILACATSERVRVYRIKLIDGGDSGEEPKFGYDEIHHYITGSKATAITFSPKTNFSQAQNNFLNLAISCEDFCILILAQTFVDNPTSEDNSEQHCLNGHTDYINDMAFEPFNGNSLASVSDDCTCRVWSLNNYSGDPQTSNLEMKIILTSPGINVKWHTSEPNKLFVSEKKGLIRFYDTNSHVAVMSFDCNRYPLMSSDWCDDNNLFIGCVAGKEVFFWDSSLTSLPIKVLKTNAEGLTEFEFYDSKIVAYRGRPNNSLTVKNFTNNQLYIDKEFVAGHGISWNRKLPILAVGGSKAIHVFKINTL